MNEEIEFAKEVVQTACQLATTISNENFETLIKVDLSPVTIADLCVQLYISYCLIQTYSTNVILIAEEELDSLKDNPHLVQKVIKYLEPVLNITITKEQIFEWMSLGQGSPNSKRFWTLDPIDGTKGFLRGEQYAICLALLVDYKVEVAVMGCPNLELENYKGHLFWAVKGKGAYRKALLNDQNYSIHVSQIQNTCEACFCESVESSHSDHSATSQIAQKLGIHKPPIRMDSQCKYGMVAAGFADIYIRMPVRKEYEEKIWDHAAGFLIVTEAGGIVTDINGKILDFSVGKTLKNNSGVVACPKSIHSSVIERISFVKY